MPDGPEVAALRLQILADKGYLLFLQGRYDEQVEIGATMLPVARQLGELGPLQRTHNMIATAAQGSGQLDLALEHFSTSLELTIRAGDRLVEALAHSNLGILYQYRGEFGQARVELTRALELRRELGAERRDINTLQRLGWVSLGEGDIEAAIELGERAHDLATRASDRWAADCHDLLGTIFTMKTEWSVATSHFEEAVALRQHGPHVVGRVQTLLGFGTLRQQTGDWAGARELYARALEIASSVSPSPWLVAARRQLGRLRYLTGESDGLDLMRAAVDLAETMPRSIQYGPTLLAAVECGLWRDDRDGALGALERALASGLTAEVRIDVLCALARFAAEAGDIAAGEQHIESARALVEKLGMPRARCVLFEAAGLLAAARGDGAAASDAFTQALAVAHLTGLVQEQTRLAARFETSGVFERLEIDAVLAEASTARDRLRTV